MGNRNRLKGQRQIVLETLQATAQGLNPALSIDDGSRKKAVEGDLVRYSLASENEDGSSSWEIVFITNDFDRYIDRADLIRAAFEDVLGGEFPGAAETIREEGLDTEYQYTLTVQVYV